MATSNRNSGGVVCARRSSRPFTARLRTRTLFDLLPKWVQSICLKRLALRSSRPKIARKSALGTNIRATTSSSMTAAREQPKVE